MFSALSLHMGVRLHTSVPLQTPQLRKPYALECPIYVMVSAVKLLFVYRYMHKYEFDGAKYGLCT